MIPRKPRIVRGMTPSDSSVSPNNFVARKMTHINASVPPRTFACVLRLPDALVVMLWLKTANRFARGSWQPDVRNAEPDLIAGFPSEDLLQPEENVG